MDNSRILIVDDTIKNIQVLGTILKKEGYQINIAQNGIQALKIVEKMIPDLILLDIMMPELDGFQTCKMLKNDDKTKEIPIIFLTAKTEQEDIVKGFELGAVDYIGKPFNATELLVRVKSHLALRKLQRKLELQNEDLQRKLTITQELFREASSRLDGSLLGESSAIREIRDAIFRYGKQDQSLLLVGPPGSGDEAIARAIHSVSSRAKQPFIYVDCVRVQMDGKENIFNITSDDISKFDLAENGTLYLDSVQELPFSLQEQLADSLEILEENKIQGKLNPNVRVITYSLVKPSLDPEKFNFNPRLSNILEKNILKIPSLMDRKSDIPILVNYFAKFYAQRIGKNFEKISPESINILSKYSWPGNIRELQSVLERNVILNEKEVFEISEEFLEKGKTLDRYNLIRKLDEGGMGEVWLAKHQMLARPAAVKLIRTDIFDDAQKKGTAMRRFQLEAETTANLLSPNTVKLYDYGLTEKKSLYYVMELLNGLDLHSLVIEFGALLPSRLVYLLKQVCRSLIEAHDAGLIHRDIKPKNLFICKLGIEHDFLKILDFGIAKRLYNEISANITVHSEFVGSPIYTAPELFSGKDVSDKADIYSLGCTAYWALTGQNVIKSKKLIQIVTDHLKVVPQKPSEILTNVDIPKQLEDALMACLEKKAENRPNARELWQKLDKITIYEDWNEQLAEKWWLKNLPELCVDQTDPMFA